MSDQLSYLPKYINAIVTLFVVVKIDDRINALRMFSATHPEMWVTDIGNATLYDNRHRAGFMAKKHGADVMLVDVRIGDET